MAPISIPQITFFLSDTWPDFRQGPVVYGVAGQTVVASAPLRLLTPFVRSTDRLSMPPAAGRTALETLGSGVVTHDAPAWIGNAMRRVTSVNLGSLYRLTVEGSGRVLVDCATGCATVEDISALPAAAAIMEEVLIGPALLLILAARGIFTFHGSAVVWDDAGIVFLGESGQGKSTLAQHLAEQSGEITRLADDILPACFANDHLMALPDYPQLKLTDDQQRFGDAGHAVSVAWFYQLELPSDSADERIRLTRVSRAQAMLLLARHCASSRLFGRDLLTAHLDWCRRAAKMVHVARLSYPRRFELLPDVAEKVRRELMPRR